MNHLTRFLGFLGAGLSSFDDLIDENDRLAHTVETLRARVIEQQRTIDDLEARLADLDHPSVEAVSPSGNVRRWQDPPEPGGGR